jgi:hypothetical protein
MTECPSDSWEHALWSGLSLELVARAALSNLSPTLLADVQNQRWGNLAHALGFPPFEAKFSPMSIGTTVVLARLRTLLPNFDTELESFCATHVGRRNAELHSGAMPYDGVHGSRWHGPYYRAASALLASMGYTLEEFIGAEQAGIAAKEIAAAADEAEKGVLSDLAKHSRVWKSKDRAEQAALTAQAVVWATKGAGHRVTCPACGNYAIVVGEPIGAPQQTLKNDEITEVQEHLPHWFQCIACGLKVVGLSRLQVVGLGDRYTSTRVYEAADYYASEDQHANFEDDNNEPF